MLCLYSLSVVCRVCASLPYSPRSAGHSTSVVSLSRALPVIHMGLAYCVVPGARALACGCACAC